MSSTLYFRRKKMAILDAVLLIVPFLDYAKDAHKETEYERFEKENI
jgi:hypothetical protein